MHIRVYLTWRLSPRRPKGLIHTRRAGVFQLAMRAGVALRAAAFQLAMRAPAAVRAAAFPLAMWAGVALRAVAFQLAMRAGVAVRAVAFQLVMRAPLSLSHRVPLTRVPRRTPRVATASWPRASPCGSTTRILIREKKTKFRHTRLRVFEPFPSISRWTASRGGARPARTRGVGSGRIRAVAWFLRSINNHRIPLLRSPSRPPRAAAGGRAPSSSPLRAPKKSARDANTKISAVPRSLRPPRPRGEDQSVD